MAVAQVFDEVVKSDFGGVAGAVEHGFASEKPANRDAINAADEFVILPAFEAVSVALLVKLSVGFKELARDPGGTAAGPGCGAALHDIRKSAIDRDLEYAFANYFGETMGDVKLIEFENGSRIGRPPGDGFVSPGKNAVAIGEQQSRNGQVTANGNKTVGVCAEWAGKCNSMIKQDRHDRSLRFSVQRLTHRLKLRVFRALRENAFGIGRTFPSPRNRRRSFHSTV
jgi:hypothetical protein